MGFHGGGWFSFLSSTGEKPKVTLGLLRRVLGYSKPYRWQLASMLVLILFSTGLTLLTPLILRDLIDKTIPSGNLSRLVLLAISLLLIPVVGGAIGVVQRRLNAMVGEGVIYDLRVALYARLQRMSLHFFTNTKLGELMSRLNNDVVGAQNAISNTIVNHHHQHHPGSRSAGGHADPGMAADIDQHHHPAALYPGCQAYGRQIAQYIPPANGSQCPDERHHERNAQYWRGIAGQAVWTNRDGSKAL